MTFSTIHRSRPTNRGALLTTLGLIGLLASTTAGAQEVAKDGRFSVQGGAGLTASPDSFLLEFEGAYEFGNGFAAGPAIQFGLDNHFLLVAPTVFGRYGFDLSGVSQKVLQPLTPYVQTGMGFAYMEEGRRNTRDEADFLINLGVGADYALTDHVSVGSRMLFNFLPDKVLGQSFYYSWQVAALRYRF